MDEEVTLNDMQLEQLSPRFYMALKTFCKFFVSMVLHKRFAVDSYQDGACWLE